MVVVDEEVAAGQVVLSVAFLYRGVGERGKGNLKRRNRRRWGRS